MRNFDKLPRKEQIRLLHVYLNCAMGQINADFKLPKWYKDFYHYAAGFGRSNGVKREDFDLIKNMTYGEVIETLRGSEKSPAESLNEKVKRLQEKRSAISLEYYKAVFLEIAKLCEKYNCNFDSNGGVNFISISTKNEICDNEELNEMKDFLFSHESELGLTDVWFEDGKFIGDDEEFLNAALNEVK